MKKLLVARKTPYWWGVIERAEKRLAAGESEAFTVKEHDKAASFVTCACGKQAGIPRLPRGSHDGEPVDDRLRELGYDFFDNIHAQSPSRAAKTLIKIERRAAKILASKKLLAEQRKIAREYRQGIR
jgi:hypothetical protein